MASRLEKLHPVSLGNGRVLVPARRAMLAFAVVLAVALPVLVRTPPAGLTVGQPAPRTYRASQPVRIVDDAATAASREEARRRASPVATLDPDADDLAVTAVEGVFSVASERRAQGAAALLREYPTALDERAAETLAALSGEALDTLEQRTAELVGLVLGAAVTAEDLPQARARLDASARALRLPKDQRHVAGVVGSWALRANVRVDEAATARARERAAQEVEPVVVSKQAGENIVEQGEIVTTRHVALMRRLGMFDTAPAWPAILATVLLLGGAVGAGGAYLAYYEPKVAERPRDVLMVAALFVGGVYLMRLAVWVSADASAYLLPVACASMLATLLLNARIGVLLSIATSLTALLIGSVPGVWAAAMLLAGLTASVAMARMRERRDLALAGLAVIGAVGSLAFAASLAESLSATTALMSGAWGLLSGLMASVLAYGLLPLFETAFGVVTDVRLLELANPTAPLLKELVLRAPGTYSHSLMTASLAEAGADLVGADSLLARVGAYYHDVGKIRRPEFFVENQSGHNPHESTSPTMSAVIITAHVREGVELARQYRLPEEVVDVIREHHGTSLVSYFYNKASEADEMPVEADFRYTGHRPTSREAALVMLADSVEAAARCIGKPSLPRIEAAVRKVVDAKLTDHQLDEARLTMADLENVTAVYAKMLSSIYHPRVEYPEHTTPRRSDDAG